MVVEAPEQIEGDDLGSQPAKALELDSEAVVARVRRWEEAVGQRPAIEERECRDLALERSRQRSHRSDPAVLKSVVLGLCKNVQAQDALEERRVAEGDDAVLIVRELEADRDRPTFDFSRACVKSSDSLLGESVDRTGERLEPVGVRKILILLLVPLALGSSPAGGSDLTQLVGTVGPGFTIDLADANGKHVDVLTAGRYEFVVHDLSDVHNFALGSITTNTRLFTGGIEFVGDETFTLDLTPGSYAYACSAHPDTMNGRFRVLAATPSPVPTKPLSAKVTAGAVSLSAKAVTAGAYKLTVADRSRSRNFHVVGPGVNKRTGKTFTGSVTWRVDLVAGKYKFGSDPRLTGRLVVRNG
jgi:hypothetical protein